MNRTLVLLAPSVLLGCTGPVGSGTAVGNPPTARLRAATSATVEVMEAELRGASLELTPCRASEPVVSLHLGDLDLVDAPRFTLPAVQPCGATLVAERLELEAFEHTSREVEIELAMVEITLGPTLDTLQSGESLDGAHVLELAQPEWLAELQDPQVEDDVWITPDDPRHAELQAELSSMSALWQDRDQSALVEEAERDVAVLAAWEEQVSPR